MSFIKKAAEDVELVVDDAELVGRLIRAEHDRRKAGFMKKVSLNML